MIIFSMRHRNEVAFINEEDEHLAKEWWYLWNYKRQLYAQNCKGEKLHHFVFPKREGFVAAHKDHNGLNCLRNNLEYVTDMENLQNKIRYKNNASGCSGVKFNKCNSKWESQITVYGKRIYLGIYQHKLDAIAAREAAELKYNRDPR